MAENKTSFNKENQPENRRGRSRRTLILDAIRERALFDVPENASNEDTERAYFAELLKQAFMPEGQNAGLCLRLVTERGWAAIKPSSDCIEFEFDEDAPPHIQSSQVLKAVSSGQVPPDLGALFIGSIRHVMEIKDLTEFEERLKALEDASSQD